MMVFIRTLLILFIMTMEILLPPELVAQPSTSAQNVSSQKPSINPRQESRPVYGGTLRWGVATKPTIINPILTQTGVSATIAQLISDPLVRIDHRGNLVPGVAKSWGISEDGLVYTLHLRPGVLFHDGVELTAEDVVFTYNQTIDPKNNSPFRSHFVLVKSFEAIDRYTFRITLKELFPNLLGKLFLEIIPKHILKNEDLHNTDFNYNPIGTGPFRFVSWDQESHNIKLETNPDYFEGRPYLDGIDIKLYDDNERVWIGLMQKEIDLAQFISRENFLHIKNDDAFKNYKFSFGMYYAMRYNLKDSIWRDKELRKAVAYAINKKDIMKRLPKFDGAESTGPFHTSSEGYDHAIKPFAYNPVKAKQILMHRGWKALSQDVYGGENTIRTKHGQELELKVLVNTTNDIYKNIIAMMRQQLSEIGIKLIVLPYYDEKELTEEYLNEHQPQAWLRIFVGHGLDKFDNYDAAINWYSLSDREGEWWNYKNEEVDALFELSRRTQDKIERVTIYKRIHQIVYEDQPACFLFFPEFYFAINANFKNTDDYFSMGMSTWMIKDWYYRP